MSEHENGSATPDDASGAGTPLPPPPGGGQQMSVSDERLWATLAHASGLVLGFIGPLAVYLVFGPRSAFVRDQSGEALNFQLTLLIAYVVSAILVILLIGLVLLLVVWVASIVLMILAAVRANAGETYRYPVNIRFVRN
jgi:uncharacterized protein